MDERDVVRLAAMATQKVVGPAEETDWDHCCRSCCPRRKADSPFVG